MSELTEIKDAVKSYYDIFFDTGVIYGKLAKSHGLTSSAFFVLQAIHAAQTPCTMSLICEKLLYPKQTVNAILNAFEDSGYLERRTDSSDRRNKHLFLTEAGQRYAAPIMADLSYLEEGAFLSMDPAAMRAMLDGERAFQTQLSRMWDSLEQAKTEQQQNRTV